MNGMGGRVGGGIGLAAACTSRQAPANQIRISASLKVFNGYVTGVKRGALYLRV